jgi:hypothetical protein
MVYSVNVPWRSHVVPRARISGVTSPGASPPTDHQEHSTYSSMHVMHQKQFHRGLDSFMQRECHTQQCSGPLIACMYAWLSQDRNQRYVPNNAMIGNVARAELSAMIQQITKCARSAGPVRDRRVHRGMRFQCMAAMASATASDVITDHSCEPHTHASDRVQAMRSNHPPALWRSPSSLLDSTLLAGSSPQCGSGLLVTQPSILETTQACTEVASSMK